jgi:hypothetical protein
MRRQKNSVKTGDKPMSKFVLEIELDEKKMETPGEIAEIISTFGCTIRNFGLVTDGEQRYVRDAHWNVVGFYRVIK